MILDDFRHQPSHSSPRAGKQMHDLLTTGFDFESTLDSINLAPDPADPCQKLLLLSNGVRHGPYRGTGRCRTTNYLRWPTKPAGLEGDQVFTNLDCLKA
jgi:hypothetical protein